MASRTTRRKFIQTTAAAAAGVGYWVAGGTTARASRMVNDEIRFACIGVEGKGRSDSEDAGNNGRVVAVVDIDEVNLNAAGDRFEGARKFIDYRAMFDEMADEFDAFTVTIPDHQHACAAVQGMRLGKHCFCQKPLTHAVYEARVMAQVAQENNLATQMGNQGTASNALRRAAALLKAGVLGEVTEVHAWTNRPSWAQGGPRPEEEEAPANVHWEEYIGPAPYRPYAKGYHPFSWRGWWDFGTGTLGDMGCHTLNLAYMGLDLRYPTAIEAQTSGHNGDSFPSSSTVVYEFPANDWRGPLKLYWYDHGRRPPTEIMQDLPQAQETGSVVVGEKGKLLSNGDYGDNYELIGEGLEEPRVEFPRSPGHFAEWIRAIRTGEPAMSNFPGYASPLTETVLLGNLAVWVDGRIEWDAENMQVTNHDGLEDMIQPKYRDGYTIEV